MYRSVIPRLIRREDLTREDARSVMLEIMEGNLSSAQIGAFLAALTGKGETAEELAGLAEAMRAKATKVRASGELMDTCGTGGSGLSTANTSTMAAFILASAGVRVAKHGNRAQSGQCGSMDVLEAVGVPIDLGAAEVEILIDRCGIGFMYAPKFHPAMAAVASVRRELGFRTTFNFLGPLANPAGAALQVLGVGDRQRAPLMIEALRRLGSRRVLVACGEDGLDEVTLTGKTHLWMLAEGGITREEVSPETVGLEPVRPAQIRGGGREENARMFLSVLGGEERGPLRDLAALNAAAGLYVAERASSLLEGFHRSLELLRAGEALSAFERYRIEARTLVAPSAAIDRTPSAPTGRER